ncbi:MAG: glycosyl hydrolase 53 family protein [Prevotella sp.]|nr:glycosyl hydrolase 53 family protein [Prevotella sp.]
MMKKTWMFFLLLVAPVLNATAQTTQFARGADISWATEMEADGRVFRNANGEVTDIFALMGQIGMSAVRLRVWVNPERFGYGPWSDKADVIAKAKRAHAQGLDVMIDFHYSDFFADPGNQRVPLDWEGYTMEQLKTAVANHTKDVLQTLKDEGINPKWVQVGNETNSGMLWDYGKIDWNKSGSNRFTNYAAVSNAGYDAVKAVFPDAYVIVHIGGAHNVADYDGWFFKEFRAAGGKFDMIGLSHYPDYNNWSSTQHDVVSNPNAEAGVKTIGELFGVPVMICETGFSNYDPKKASTVMHDLMAHMKAIPHCAGVFYWEPQVDGQWKPDYYNQLGWGAYGMGAFTTDGKPTAALDAFRDETDGIENNNRETITYNRSAEQWFDLQGRRLHAPQKGLTIVKLGQHSRIMNN